MTITRRDTPLTMGHIISSLARHDAQRRTDLGAYRARRPALAACLSAVRGDHWPGQVMPDRAS